MGTKFKFLVKNLIAAPNLSLKFKLSSSCNVNSSHALTSIFKAASKLASCLLVSSSSVPAAPSNAFVWSCILPVFSAKIIPHFFSTPANIFDGSDKVDNNLGTEIDLTVGYKLAKDITLSAGYSKMFATETMEILKEGGDKDADNSWSWIMFTFKPKLFSSKID